MFHAKETSVDKPAATQPRPVRKGSARIPKIGLNAVIVLLAVLVLLLTYSLVLRTIIRPPVEPGRAGSAVAGVGSTIQLDVLNGCGSSGAASHITAYLRARGFDVVEMRNYRSFDVAESMVVDRTGNLENARRVAYAVGIPRSKIVQQINPDYYVDVSVVVGRDYQTLNPLQQEGNK
jgi:hypothetical protein